MEKKKFDLTEFEKLVKMCADAKIPFETEKKTQNMIVTDVSYDGFPYEHYEIYYPSIEVHLSDAVISFATYGREEGKLEQYGLLPEEVGDSVEGYLDAETIFKRWEEDWNARQQIQKPQGFYGRN